MHITSNLDIGLLIYKNKLLGEILNIIINNIILHNIYNNHIYMYNLTIF